MKEISTDSKIRIIILRNIELRVSGTRAPRGKKRRCDSTPPEDKLSRDPNKIPTFNLNF